MPKSPETIPSSAPRFVRADVIAILSIFVLASFVRLLFLHQARACPQFDYLIVDARAYNDWSDAIVAGDWIGDRVFYQAPLYPYFLALIKLTLGSDLTTIRIVQAVLGAITCVMLYLSGRLFVGHAAGATAGVMLALYPPAIFFDALIQKAGLGSFLTALLLAVLASQQLRAAAWKAGCLGVVLGLLMLTREETLLLAPVLMIWLWMTRGRAQVSRRAGRIAQLPAFIIGLAVSLSPVVARNYHVGGEFVLTTSQAGSNFYIGNNASASGMYAPLRPGRSDTRLERLDAIELAEQASGRSLSASEVSQFWFGRAFEFIRSSPRAWLALMGSKAALLLNAYEVPDAENQYFYEEYAPMLRALSHVWHWGILLPFAIAGMILSRLRKRDVGILLLLIATLCASVLIFYVFGRYRFTLVGPLMLFAGFAISEAFSAVRRREGRILTPAALAALAVAVLANWPMFARQHLFAESFSNAGAAVAASGDDRRAIELFRKSIEHNPALPDTLCNLAMSTARLGRLHDAIPLLRQALSLRSNDPRIRMMLGTALAEAGALLEAEVHLSAAVLIAPNDVDSRTNYQSVLLRLARWKQAIEQAHAIVALRPDDAAALAELAWLLASCADVSLRDGPAAVEAAEKAVRMAGPGNAELLEILACAYAQAGRFDAAMKAATQARKLASEQSLSALVQRLDEHMRLFGEGRVIPGQ